MIINLSPIKKRRVKLLFATFFCISFGLVSCKKNETNVGKEILTGDQILNSLVTDTFALTTYTFKEDSVNSKNQIHALLGAVNDPKFGISNASFYTQVRLDNPGSTVFGVAPVVDSIVLSLGYAGYYGKATTQTFEVYEMTQDLSATEEYYSFSTATFNPTNLVVPGKGTITPKPTTKVVVGADTVGAQLRLPLVNSFATFLMDGVAAGHYVTQDAFKAFFKGLHLKVSNASPSSSEGGVMYYDLNNINTRLTIFYTSDGLQKKYSYLLNGSCVNFNHLDFNQVGTPFQNVVDDSTKGQKEFYAQAFTSRAVIQFPTIKDLPANALIHKASLILPVSHYSNDLLYPSSKVTTGFRLLADDEKIFSGDNFIYQAESKEYIIDLRKHIQGILIGQIPNRGVLIRPSFFNATLERIVFNGPEGIYKKKPKLVITYTTY
jgi:hypothetical protein